MSLEMGLVGRKCGMTRIFTEEGAVPVTVIEVPPNRVSQIKTLELDGYFAIQIVVGTKKASRVNKAMAGHFTKANTEAGSSIHEFSVTTEQTEKVKLGDQFTVEGFKEGQMVDVRGLTKGKGFAGTVKRHHFSMQDATHGNSLSHRAPGSIGQRQTPGRVFKGKKMSGHLGNKYRTIQNLEVIKVDATRNLILVKGAIPGAPGGSVIVTSAIKQKPKEK